MVGIKKGDFKMTNIMVHDTEEELIQTFKKMLETLCEKYNTTTTDIISNDEINLEEWGYRKEN